MKRDGQVNRCAFRFYGLTNTDRRNNAVRRSAVFILDFVREVWGRYSGENRGWRFVSGFVCAPSPPVDTTEETGDTDGDRSVFASETWQRPSPAV